MKYIEIDGKRYEWKRLRELRRQQVCEAQRIQQLTSFELKDDTRPASQRTAEGRLIEPMLFKVD
jgi:hypothetical protein